METEVTSESSPFHEYNTYFCLYLLDWRDNKEPYIVLLPL